MVSEPALSARPPTERASITIERKANLWVDRARAYHLIIDDEDRGEIRRGERRTIEVEPGTVEVFLKIDWCRSHTLSLDLDEGSEVHLRCRPCGVVTVPYSVTIGRKNHIRLDVVG